MTDWQQILDDNAHSLWHIIYQLLSNQHEASECFKDAFINTYQDQVNNPSRANNIYPNIAKAAISNTLDKLHQRFQSKLTKQDATDMVVIPTNGPKPLAKIKSQELAGRLRKALSQVPAQKAQIFCLSKFVGLSNKQIAKTYDLNKNAVNVLIHQTQERLTSLLELRNAQRITGENKNIVKEAVDAIKQESVSTNPPGKILHEITSVFPAPAEPQMSEAMQKKSKIIRRIKALNRFKIIIAVVILVGALITAKLFTFIQQKQLEKADQNSNLVVIKLDESKLNTDKPDDIESMGKHAETEFTKIMERFAAGDANGVTALLGGDSLLNKIILAKFLGEMGDEESIKTLELFYKETQDLLRGKIEPNPFLDAIDKIHDRLGYEEVKPAEPKDTNTPADKKPEEKTEPENTQGITGDVISIQGYPVENAVVIISNSENPAFIENGQADIDSGLDVTFTESSGKFSFDQIENDNLITVIHETGFAEITKQDLQKDPTIVLTDWGYITGQLLIAEAFAANESIELTYLTGENDKAIYSHSATTDYQGQFTFENIKPGKVKITHIFDLPIPRGYNEALIGKGSTRIVNVNSEKETDIALGEVGYTFKGKLALGEDFDLKPDWLHVIAEVVSSDKKNTYSVETDDDGSFGCRSLPADTYELSVTLYTNEDGSYFERAIADLQISFTLPGADPNEKTLDLGTFEMEPIQ